jgi:SAM-dependent methyltransferase
VTYGAGDDGWRDFHERVDALRPPQRPDAGVVARLTALIEGRDARILLLGVTRQLTGLGADLTAVDQSREQIERLWRGDRPCRRALRADWRDMDLPRGHFTAAIGDGSLSALAWPDDNARVLARVAGALASGGRLAIRCFLAPDEPEPLEQVAEDVLAGREPDFHATRWRVAMAACGPDGNVAVGDILTAFERIFPDREELSARTGWPLETIAMVDPFRDSPLVYSFVTRSALLAVLPGEFVDPRFVPSGDYPLAERCPFLVAERAG